VPPIVYYAGVNTSPFCEAFVGLPVLETFADLRDVVAPYRPLFSRVALDCGAYSARTRGINIDLGHYIEFCLARPGFYDFVASLDVIGGTLKENISNWCDMVDRGVPAMPTWHTGEPPSLLKDYCEEAPKIGLGITRPNNKMPPPAEVRRMLDAAFEHVPSGHPVHGWGLTNYTDYPFHSVDSTTWLREYLDIRAYRGQGSAVLRCLTNREIIELVQKKYERGPRRDRAEGVVYEDVNPSQGDVQ
jgi:hypothetical protein